MSSNNPDPITRLFGFGFACIFLAAFLFALAASAMARHPGPIIGFVAFCGVVAVGVAFLLKILR